MQQARYDGDVLAAAGPYEYQTSQKYGLNTARAALFLLVLAGLCGVFGRGPLATGTVRSADGAVIVTYDRFARFRTPSSMQIGYAGAVPGGRLHVVVSNGLLAAFSIVSTTPRALAERAIAAGTEYTFATSAAPSDRAIVFALQPSRSWYVSADVIVEDRLMRLPVMVYP